MTLGRWSLVLLQILVIGCALPDDYRGDGDFTDRGFTTATDRYVLDLGIIEYGKSSYKLAGLPDVVFAVGLHVDDLGLEEAEAALREGGAEVRLALTTADGQTVFDQPGQLADWVWTSGVHEQPDAFAYRRGEYQEIPQRDGDFELQKVGTGADEGWGTYFKPRRGEEYRLKVTVSSAGDFFSSHTVRLLARGGGWK